MTTEEFDVLEELYFPINFDDLMKATEISEEKLLEVLCLLYEKKWLRCFLPNSDEEIVVDLMKNYKNYRFNASKKGLLAHNGIEK